MFSINCLPTLNSGKSVVQYVLIGVYSSGYCPGFTPDSLLSPIRGYVSAIPKSGTKVEEYFRIFILIPDIFGPEFLIYL